MATLPAEGQGPKVAAPDLPDRLDSDEQLIPWHEQTLAFWKDAWASPMAQEFVKADHHGLFLLADLVDSYWWTRDARLLPEIRLQRQAFGFTPIDRRRLQWEIERGEEAQERGSKRKAGRSPATRRPRLDPAKVLEGRFSGRRGR